MKRLESGDDWIREAISSTRVMDFNLDSVQRNGRNDDGMCMKRMESRDDWTREAIPTTRVMDFNTLIGMGFGCDVSINAINKSENLNGAVDGILNRQIRELKHAAKESMGDVTVRSGRKQMRDEPIKARGRMVETCAVNV